MITEASPNMRRLILIVFAIFTVLASPTLAIAAEGPWKSVDLRLISAQSGQPVLLVAGQLPASTPLPAKVTLAIPAGTTIEWAGEILGGDPSKDPSVKYTVKTGRESDLVAFTLTTSRIGQVEVSVPGGYSANGGTSRATIAWAAPFDIPSVSLFALLPSGATVTSGTAGGKKTTIGTDTWYQRDIKRVSKGDRLKLEVDFTGGTARGTASAGPTQSQPGTVTPVSKDGASPLLIVSVLGLLLSVTYALWRRVSPDPTQTEELEEGDTAESAE